MQEAVTLQQVPQIRSAESTHILWASQWGKVAEKQDFPQVSDTIIARLIIFRLTGLFP
jgi:hypothetical protein